MADTEYESSIVVGVDGSTHAKAAVDWAAEWAHSRGDRLVLVVGVGPDPTSYSPQLGNRYFGEMIDAGRGVIDLAMADAKRRHPGLDISQHLSEVSPAAALVHASKTAVAVVIGSQGRTNSRKMPLGGVADAVVRHAHGPVIVVPEHARHRNGPVTVGVDISEHCKPAMQFAFDEAQRRSVPINLVHGYKGEFRWGSMYDEVNRHEELKRFLSDYQTQLDEFVEPYISAHPGVEVKRHFEDAFPIKSVARVGRQSSLTVMGSRGKGSFTRLLLGSTSRGLLDMTHSPVAIIHG